VLVVVGLMSVDHFGSWRVRHGDLCGESELVMYEAGDGRWRSRSRRRKGRVDHKTMV
jgi:hypothetical protein